MPASSLRSNVQHREVNEDMKDIVVRNEALAGLREQIIAARERYAAAVAQIRELDG
jgi:hypothetical protein